MIEKERLHPHDQQYWHGWMSYICGKWEIARRFNPRHIVEIGVRTGYSAWAFLQAAKDAKYIGFDNYSYGEYPDWAKANLLAGYDATILKADTQSMDDLGVEADFVHVDGDHTTAGVMHDLDLAVKVLKNGGTVLIDDYDRIPDVKAGVDAWLEQHSFESSHQMTFTGDIVIKVPKQKTSDKGKLLVFHHGLGDVLMFLPLLYRLRQEGRFTVAFQQRLGFTNLTDDAIETPPGDFDYASLGYESVQIVRFEMSEGSGITKTALCAKKEFGIEGLSVAPNDMPVMASKVVGVHFQGTCLPGQTNPDEATARQIWDEIKEAGCVPLEVNFEHVFHNPANARYPWIDRSTRGIAPSTDVLAAILHGCSAFIGVASGVWVAAYCKKRPEYVCLMEKNHRAEAYFDNFSNESHRIDINNYKPGSVKAWLNSLSL